MNIYDFPPIAAALDTAHTAVTTLADLLTPLAGVHSTALAIVLCALLIRVALIPVGVSTARADADRRRLAPSIHRIREKYGTNPELLRRKTMELYTAEKVSPLAGCLPLLVQAPIVSVVYGLFVTPRINGHANELLGAPLFDVPLGSSLPGLVTAGTWWPDVAVVGVLLAVIAVVSALSRHVALRWSAQNPAPAATPRSPGSPAMPVIPAGTLAMLSWLPFLTVVFAAIVPLAATLYLTVTTAWTLAERVLLRRRFDRLAAARASSQP
ncbi:YidC/Oxa1 family membrane protein insertase [Marisediminicola senii]|uniref:YidC/Oxa1 family membrane protein insertase n=1 Tax=Marisediminicola senii TaxID=2711233 RepID=UPI0013EB3954|nr:membrane protein insertase YidC [Marisediminicola senii]